MLSVIKECIVNEETGSHSKRNVAWFVSEKDAQTFKKILEEANQAEDIVYYQIETEF